MSGHSKWAQIKRKKEKTDAQKSKIFSKFARLISVEAKKAGNNLNAPGLRAVVERARAENMPNDSIERAIKKAMDISSSMEEANYETYGPGGTAIIINTLSDNKNRTSQEIKHILNEFSLSLASPGSALWAFKKDNNLLVPTSTTPISDDDAVILEKIVDSLQNHDDVQDVFTNAE